MQQQASLWSRFWGAVAAAAFWLYLGAVVYEAAVMAPQWAGDAPQSVRAWYQSGVRPESQQLLTPLTALVAGATALAWASSLRVKSSRRWWLTMAAGAALAVVWTLFAGLLPSERSLRGASASDLQVIDLTGEWIRWSAARLGALALGAYAAYRAHISRPVLLRTSPATAVRAPSRDFVLSDDDRERITFGDD